MAKGGRPLKCDPRMERVFIDIQDGNNPPVMKLLEELGVDATDGYKRTVLINAAFYGNFALMEWCLARGADIDFRDKAGMAALHFAAQENRADVLEYLLDKGASMDIQDNYGNSPLLNALTNWNQGKAAPSVDLLLSRGVDVYLKNNYEVTPWECMGEEMQEEYSNRK